MTIAGFALSRLVLSGDFSGSSASVMGEAPAAGSIEGRKSCAAASECSLGTTGPGKRPCGTASGATLPPWLSLEPASAAGRNTASSSRACARGADLVIDLRDECIAFLDSLLVLGCSSTLFNGGLAGLDLDPDVNLLVACPQELGTVHVVPLALGILRRGDLVVIAVDGVGQLATGGRQGRMIF
jgi:hypothetical protein